MIYITLRASNQNTVIEINDNNKIVDYPFIPLENQSGNYYRMEFNFKNDTVSIILSSFYTNDKVILPHTKANDIFWKFEIDGILEESINNLLGTRDLNYIKKFFYDYYLEFLEDNNQSSPPPTNNYNFTSPIVINNLVLELNYNFPDNSEIQLFYYPSTGNPSTNINGVNDDLPNTIFYSNNITGSQTNYDLQSLPLVNGLTFDDISAFEMRVGIHDGTQWVLSNIVTIQ